MEVDIDLESLVFDNFYIIQEIKKKKKLRDGGLCIHSEQAMGKALLKKNNYALCR